MSTVPTYMVTVAPGLEDVAISELTTKLPGAWIQAQLRGRVLFVANSPWEDLQQLRCVDNIYVHIGWLKVGPHKADLEHLTKDIENMHFPDIPYLLPKTKARAIVNASRSGHHTFNRFDAGWAVLEGLTAAHGFVPGTTEAYDCEFRLDIVDHDALISLKLTSAAFRFRGQRTFSRAALRPPIAHALVWLSEPRSSDVFLDPFCGSGTIPIERATYEAVSITGGDISPTAIEAARENAPAEVTLRCLDACDLWDTPSASVNAIVTNLPWGKQIAAPQEIETLYRQFLLETKRVLAPTGRAIMLTDREEAIDHACNLAQLICRPLLKISLHGSLPTVYLVCHPV
ncbi:MAG: methyltransferase domain-containing protein [Firmicutes bacterium]|nr:methyltransferase domain-containing protein [Bacillota bacterium]